MKNLVIKLVISVYLLVGIYSFLAAQTPLSGRVQTNIDLTTYGGFGPASANAVNSAGYYVIGWDQHSNASGSNLGLPYIRVYNNNGTPLCNPVLVSTNRGDLSAIRVGIDDNNDVYVYYDEYVGGNNVSYEGYLKKYSSTGTLLAGPILVETYYQTNEPRLQVRKDGYCYVSYINKFADEIVLKVFSPSCALISSNVLAARDPDGYYNMLSLNEAGNKLLAVYRTGGSYFYKKIPVATNGTINTNVTAGNFLPSALNWNVRLLSNDNIVAVNYAYGTTDVVCYDNNNSVRFNFSIPNSIYARFDVDERDWLYIVWQESSLTTFQGKTYDTDGLEIGTFTPDVKFAPVVSAKNCHVIVSGVFSDNTPATYIYHQRFKCPVCENLPPSASGINGGYSTTYEAYELTNFCFTINSTDLDPSDIVTMTYNINGIPGASFSITAGNHPTGQFCWTPPASSTGNTYSFTVTVTDNAASKPYCKINAQTTFTYYIHVNCVDCNTAVYYENRHDASRGPTPYGLLPPVTISQSFIRAGKAVTPNLVDGLVVVESYQDVKFFYATQTVLSNGFVVEEGADFLVQHETNQCVSQCQLPPLSVQIIPSVSCDGWLLSTNISGHGPPYNITWTYNNQTANTPTILVSPTSTTIYTVTVTDNIGGSATDNITLDFTPYHGNKPIAFPDAFTPDGDGLNDNWVVLSGNPNDEFFAYNSFYFYLEIFNRWGQKIYTQTSNLMPNNLSSGFVPEQIHWNGFYQGVLQPEETYVYQLILVNCDGASTYSGDFISIHGSAKKENDDIIAGVPANDPTHSYIAIAPNPFTDATDIEFSLARDENVSVVITDLLGKEIYTPMMKGNFASGTHRIKIDGMYLSEGVYLARIHIGEKEYTRRIVKL